MLVLAWAILVFASRHGVAVVLNQQSGIGIAAILTAAAFFVLLSLDRGLLQAHRSYQPLAVNLIVEMGVRVVAVLVLVLAGFGPSGAAVGVLIGEVLAAAHARWAAVRAWSGGVVAPAVGDRRLGGGRAPRPRARRWRLRAPHGRARPGGGVGVALDGRGAAERRRARRRARQPHAQRCLRRGVGHEQGDRLRGHRARWLPAARGGHPLAPGRPCAAATGRRAGAPRRALGPAARHRARGAAGVARDRVPPRLHVRLRRARTTRRGHDHAERLGRADHVPVGGRAPLGGRRARGRRRRTHGCRADRARVTPGDGVRGSRRAGGRARGDRGWASHWSTGSGSRGSLQG